MQSYLDPHHVPEALATGPCNAHVAGGLLILTFTANRPDVGQLFAGSKDPDLNAVVVARLAVPLENAAQVAKIIINILTSLGASNGAA